MRQPVDWKSDTVRDLTIRSLLGHRYGTRLRVASASAASGRSCRRSGLGHVRRFVDRLVAEVGRMTDSENRDERRRYGRELREHAGARAVHEHEESGAITDD